VIKRVSFTDLARSDAALYSFISSPPQNNSFQLYTIFSRLKSITHLWIAVTYTYALHIISNEVIYMDLNEECKEEIRTIFDCVPPRGGAIFAAIIADILADGLDPIQIAVIATFITAVGDSMGYIAAQMDLNEQIVARQKERTAGTPTIVPPAPN
jgi:hypothetical protein